MNELMLSVVGGQRAGSSAPSEKLEYLRNAECKQHLNRGVYRFN